MSEQENSKVELTEEELRKFEEEKRKFKEDITFFAQRALNFRDEMPEHEAKHPWLCTLLDAYAIINGATSFLIEEEAKLGSSIACKEGCYYCCVEPIPASPLESLGLAFATRYLLTGSAKKKLDEQLLEQNGNVSWKQGTCPFLIENTCSIYPLRPVACRNYMAFNKACYLKEGGIVIFHNELENYRIPNRAALQLANLHMTQTSQEMGLYKGEENIISFDNSKGIYLDVRAVDWLTNDFYERFFKE